MAMRILITGASGLIGRELAGVLAGRGHAVLALLHRNHGLSRNDGTKLPSAPWTGAPPAPGQVATVHGDICARHFGLEAAACASLAAELDLIVHCAALTGFNLDDALYQRVNVGGAANVLDVAAHGGPRPVDLLQVSTAYVCGERSGLIEELPVGDDTPFANGYEASKAAAEGLALAHARDGLGVAIARPSIVVGSSKDGTIGAFGGIYQVLRLLTDGRIDVLPAILTASLDLVPIDHVVDSLADLAERMAEAKGGIFHLTSGAPVTLGALLDSAWAYPHFRLPRLIAPEAFDPDRLDARARLMHDQVTGVYASYIKRDPRFCDKAARALTGRTCPPTGEAFLHRMIDHCIEAGFLRSADCAQTQRMSG